MSGPTKPSSYTPKEVLQKFKNYIRTRKTGLKRFYNLDGNDEGLEMCAARGSDMTEKLMAKGCPREVAAELTLLALWDLVVLIDNSISMGIDEDGGRVTTLANTLRATSTVYSFARKEGIKAIRFLNTPTVYSNVTSKMINPLMKKIGFEGLTNIGTKLRDKVLIEGEVTGLLRDVIVSQAVKLQEEHGKDGPDAVAYQFAKIGNDKVAQDLVQNLDDDKLLGKYIDCMGNDHRLEEIREKMWTILPKLLLGAISPYWDEETGNPNDTLKNQDDKFKTQEEEEEQLAEEEEEDDIFNSVNPGSGRPPLSPPQSPVHNFKRLNDLQPPNGLQPHNGPRDPIAFGLPAPHELPTASGLPAAPRRPTTPGSRRPQAFRRLQAPDASQLDET